MNYSNAASQLDIPDVQGLIDPRRIPIQSVGVTSLRSPIGVENSDGTVRATIAAVTMCVNLAADQKGAHISRFLQVLGTGGFVVSPESVYGLLAEMIEQLEAESGYIKLEFPFFMEKSAPVTGVKSLLDYEVALTGSIDNGGSQLKLNVAVPVTSLCPCSKKISREGAHNQRSRVTVEIEAAGEFWIEDVIKLVEQQASCDLYALLKRSDEKYVTEKAYGNPKFVEDMVRDVAACLNENVCVSGYSVECENFESIHNHSAYAKISSAEVRLGIVGDSTGPISDA